MMLITKNQCVIPCIEGLFPEPHNTSIIDLLFVFATWHALAKSHIHTDTSLKLLDTATTALGNALCYFTRVTCPEFDTFETGAEYAKCQRQQVAAAATQPTPHSPSSSTGRQRRTFSLKTVKLHFLGDYVSCIKMFGTTDNYNSALVSQLMLYHLIVRSDHSRESIVTIRSNSTLNRGATTRRRRNSLVRWIMLISMSAALLVIFREQVFTSMAKSTCPLPPTSHSRTPRSPLQKGTNLQFISRSGYGIIVMTLP